MQKIIELIVFWHKGQFRKEARNGIQRPYVFHPFDVSKMIWDWGAGTSVMMGASLCHDLLEHAEEFGLSLSVEEDVLPVIGEEALSIVKELTFIPKSDSVAKEKSEYMRTFQTKSVQALVIKLADRFCNVRDFMRENGDYCVKYYNKAEALLNAMVSRSEEIVAEFGEDAYENIRQTDDEIAAILAGRSEKWTPVSSHCD